MGTKQRKRGSTGLSAALYDVLEHATGESIDVGTILGQMGRRSIGAALFIFALPMVLPVPAPGISMIFGIPLVLVSAQLMIGQRLWLPKAISRRTVPTAQFRMFVERGLPVLRKMESYVRPRWAFMTHDLTMVLVGAMCVFMSIIICLPIPMGNVIPGMAISLVAIGLAGHDGAAILLGVVVGFFSLAIIVVATNGLEAAVRKLM